MAGYDYQSLGSEHPIFPSATENWLCISYENYLDNSWPKRKITFKWRFEGKELFWNSVIQIFALFSSFHLSVVVWEGPCIVSGWIILSLLGILIHRMFSGGGRASLWPGHLTGGLASLWAHHQHSHTWWRHQQERNWELSLRTLVASFGDVRCQMQVGFAMNKSFNSPSLCCQSMQEQAL